MKYWGNRRMKKMLSVCSHACRDGNTGCIPAWLFLISGRTARKTVINYPVGTKVYVNAMTEDEIRVYVATKDPLDKAGAYGIQGRFAAYIDRIDGDYYNVVGLPVSRVYRTLRECGGQ